MRRPLRRVVGGAIPSADVAVVAPAARRTRRVRVVVVLACAALLVAAIVAALGLSLEERSLLPKGTSGVVVIDLSQSVSEVDYGRIRGALDELTSGSSPLGAVIFSDVPYELVPPGSPARASRPLLRFFTPAGDTYPPNPWTSVFRAGTRISTALELARSTLEREGIARGSIVLISDLETAPSDIGPLAQTLAGLNKAQIPVRVVALTPTPNGRDLFLRLLGPKAFVDVPSLRARELGKGELALHGGTPLWLLLVAGALLLALAAAERWCTTLALAGRRSPRRGAA